MGCAASVNVGQQQPGSLVGAIGDGRDAAVLLRKLAAALREGAGFASFGPALRALPAVDAAMLDVLAAEDREQHIGGSGGSLEPPGPLS